MVQDKHWIEQRSQEQIYLSVMEDQWWKEVLFHKWIWKKKKKVIHIGKKKKKGIYPYLTP